MSGPDLPEPFASLHAAAHVEYGKRLITWRIDAPGDLHRNQFEMAWIECAEGKPWKGEPLWVSATRRPTGDSSRVSFTDRARKILQAEIAPPIARYGFDRYWQETHRSHKPRDYSNAVAEAKRVAEWYRVRADLDAMHFDGLVEFKPVENSLDYGTQTVLVVSAGSMTGRDAVNCIASAWVGGEQVGWMTTRSELVPMRSVLMGDG